MSYSTLTLEGIKKLPIEIGDAFVFCWVVNKYIEEAFDVLFMGSSYSYMLTWVAQHACVYAVVSCRAQGESCIDVFRAATFGRIQCVIPQSFYDLLRRVFATSHVLT